MKGTYICLLLASAAGTIFSPSSYGQTVAPDRPQPAQDTPTAPTLAADGSPAPGDIVVTANRREERLQDVPIAITAVSGAEIGKSSFKNLTDIQYLAPSVQINQGLSYPSYNIRGVGTQTYDTGAESSASLVIDNVVDGNTRSLGLVGLADIDRIEVLRGPQGTLFGKNSSAGVIQVLTRKPEFGKFEVIGNLNYGSYNDILGNLTVNIPLTSNLAGRIVGFYQQRDGFIHNIDGSTLGSTRDKGVRGKLRWEPGSAIKLDLSGYYSRDDNTNGFYTLRSFGAVSSVLDAPLNIVQPGPENKTSLVVGDKYWHTTNYGSSLEANVSLPAGFTLTSITAWKGWDLGSNFPVGEFPVPVFPINNGHGYHTDQYTQELRIASPVGRFTYQGGFYYYRYDLRANQLQGGTFFLPLPANTYLSPSGGDTHFKNSNKSLAAFLDGTFKLTDSLRLIGGGRYTHDDISANLNVTPVAGFIPLSTVPLPFAGRRKHDDFSWRAGVQYDLSRDVMGYATVARGYKGPVVASVNGLINNVDPETVMSYEAGIKSSFLDHHFVLNVAAFYAKYKDFQATIYDQSQTPPTSVLANASSLTTKGVEADFTVRANQSLSITGNASLNITSYGEIFTTCYPLQPTSADPHRGCAPVPGSASATWTSLKGLPLAMSPKWTFTAAANYAHDLGATLRFDGNLRYSWRSAVLSNPIDPNTRIGAYGLLNANIGMGDRDGRWRVGVYARNLLGQNFVNLIAATYFDDGGYMQIPSQDAVRSIGGTLSFKF